ncbi:MAG TPA: YhbY family RNA-binding protein [Candidatus Acidoferrales bacterium]|nr:YhbY family RNA-binding protein [Candidatus Acidoferrales bacterium]
MKMDIQKLKAQATEIDATIWVGKNGLTDSVVRELKDQLKSKRLVKVKILKNAVEEISRNRIARELEEHSGAKLLDIRGGVAVYLSPYRKRV